SLPAQLSTGEQQRVGIARAIVAQPQLLVADEPTGNLDPQLAAEIMQLFAELPASGTTVLVASHDLMLVKRMRKRVLVLDHGRLVDDISPEDLAACTRAPKPASARAAPIAPGPPACFRSCAPGASSTCMPWSPASAGCCAGPSPPC